MRASIFLCVSLWAVGAGPGVAAENAPGKAMAAERVLFDGRSLAGWKLAGFEGEGDVKVEPEFQGDGPAIVIGKGVTLSGVTWIRGGELPRTNYELSLEAMRVDGADFFCGLTFPVGKAACTFVVGGWSGMVVGISSIDDADASENETTTGMEFADKRWYRIRVRVTDRKIEAWIDREQKVDVEWPGKKIALRPGDIQQSLPLGIASYMTTAAVRNIRLKTW
jgi:hypothetical protein